MVAISEASPVALMAGSTPRRNRRTRPCGRRTSKWAVVTTATLAIAARSAASAFGVHASSGAAFLGAGGRNQLPSVAATAALPFASRQTRYPRSRGPPFVGGGASASSSSCSPVARKVLDWSTLNVADVIETSESVLISVVGWTVVAVSAAIIKVAIEEDKKDTPKAFLEKIARKQASAPVVCLGDSLTRGNLSADWVTDLRGLLPTRLGTSLPVLNAGVNMECAQNIRRRLDEIIACRPSHVTVLVGTNDLKAGMSNVEGYMYRVFGQLPEAPTLESYERDLIEIRERLMAAGASVALVSPPVLGEDLASEANRRASEFAQVVRKVAEQGGKHCAYLPLFEKTAAALPEQGGKSYDGLHFFGLLCSLCVDVHLRQRTLDELQRERELGVTVDLVHLGPAAAEQLVEMVADFVENMQPPSLPTPTADVFRRAVTA